MRLRWRWEERDFGFRFATGRGRAIAEHYQAGTLGEFYVVPSGQRKLAKSRIEELGALATVPTGSKVVANPWSNYDRDWDWIESKDGICINYAGCLDWEEVSRREDEGVARALSLITMLAERQELQPLSVELVRQIHTELAGDIYPFAGAWRTVDLHKGEGPTKWPLPPCGIQPLMENFGAEVLSRSPFISEDNDHVYRYASEVMNEFLAIHPFREGNGRTAFCVGNLILMQNDLLPLDIYDPRRHQEPYYAACEAGRIHGNYEALANLIATWEAETMARWEEANGPD
jgi:cell filamentation protein